MSILLQASLVILGIIFSLFVYWKALRDDYTQNQIFVSGFTVIISTILGSLIAQYLSQSLKSSTIFSKDGLWFWGGYAGFFIGFMINKWRYRFRVFESLEASSMMILLMSVFFARNILIAFVILILFLLCLFLRNNYRKFTWYRSGKIGFASLLTFGILFLARAIASVTPLAQGMPALFVGKVDVVVSLIVAVSLFFAFYNLAQSK